MGNHSTFPPGTQKPPNAYPIEVELAANSIGWAMERVTKLTPSRDAALAIARNLYDQGLLKLPSSTASAVAGDEGAPQEDAG